MKIYIQNCGWAGSIVVIATSEEKARELMKNCENYERNSEIECHEIVDGFVFRNLGDL